MTSALQSIAESVKRFVDLLERVEKLVLKKLEEEERRKR